VDSYSLIRPGPFFFVTPAGIYRIAAFVDVNRDFTYQPDREPAAYFGNPMDVQVSTAREVKDIDFHIAKDSRIRLDIPAIAMIPGKRGSDALPDIHVGETVKIDDPRFSVENGKLGLWQPVDFMFNIGAGIYFLETYTPHKIPVIFIHGASGTPADWQYLIEQLDRTKFQPWLVYYPSGLRNDVTAQGIARWTGILAARYGTPHFAVVAHSMGGLVARAAINQVAAEGGGKKLAAFVTISTPWAGHAAAQTGVERAPVVVPSWYDMAPGSPFLTGLFRTSMPPQCPYYLLFSYDGNSRLGSEPNDGAVALSSELSLEAQQLATKVYGFKENHKSILRSHEVSRTLNAILAETSHLDGKE
jgi:pimeloyl-ACP methyl ester carboxylesterase